MPAMDEFQRKAVDYRKLNQMSVPIAVAGPDVVFLVDWLCVWQMFYLSLIKNIRTGVLWWLSGLRIWHCHCCGSGLIPDPGSCSCTAKRKKKKKEHQKYISSSSY